MSDRETITARHKSWQHACAVAWADRYWRDGMHDGEPFLGAVPMDGHHLNCESCGAPAAYVSSVCGCVLYCCGADRLGELPYDPATDDDWDEWSVACVARPCTRVEAWVLSPDIVSTAKQVARAFNQNQDRYDCYVSMHFVTLAAARMRDH